MILIWHSDFHLKWVMNICRLTLHKEVVLSLKILCYCKLIRVYLVFADIKMCLLCLNVPGLIIHMRSHWKFVAMLNLNFLTLNLRVISGGNREVWDESVSLPATSKVLSTPYSPVFCAEEWCLKSCKLVWTKEYCLPNQATDMLSKCSVSA